MSKRRTLPIMYNNAHCYDIELTDSFDGFFDSLATLGVEKKRLCIITDSNVNVLYGDMLVNHLVQKGCPNVIKFVFPAGEENKTLSVVQKIYEHLIFHGFDRSDCLIALGGGVTGDITGFAAATYLRGIRFIQVPTTLLSMVDSSIGGKTGVDFKGYKNMVGAFHQPSLVYVNTSVLSTLPKRQFASGMGEILKHGLIRDFSYYQWLLSHHEEILSLDTESLIYMIFESQKIKKFVVEADPKEKGERAHLNFGHTIGHAVEKALDFSLFHGECVALGMVAAAYISKIKGHLSSDDLHMIETANAVYGLPVRFHGIINQTVLENLSHDKKKEGEKVKFILLEKLGTCYSSTDVTTEEINHAINYLKEGTN